MLISNCRSQLTGFRKCLHGTLIPLGLLLALLSGCAPPQEGAEVAASATAGAAEPGDQAEHITWYEGSVEEAFREAENSGKPVFLYWGAEWCPPCHELKATIFKRPEFIRQSRLFVMVYLDGDTERAQQFGERFGVMGYPTVILFSPGGEEITRIPGGMDIQQYVGVMDLALNSLRPVAGLVDAVAAGEALSREDWRLLAYYSWQQDRGRALGEQDLASVARTLADACPADYELEKSLLQMLAVRSWAVQKEREAGLGEGYRDWVMSVLDNPVLSRANLSSLAWYGGALVDSLNATPAQRCGMADAIMSRLDSALDDVSIAVLTRLDVLYGEVEVLQAAQGELTAEQAGKISRRAVAMREEVNAYQLHAALYSLAELYHLLHDDAATRATLEEGMAVSKQPYYFTAMLGDLEREAGNTELALKWYREAWNTARGPATRVQWGNIYLSAQLELGPDDLAAIESAGVIMMDELAEQPEGLRQRSALRMQRLGRQLREWSLQATAEGEAPGAREALLSRLQLRFQGVCALQQERPPVCDSFATEAPAS